MHGNINVLNIYSKFPFTLKQALREKLHKIKACYRRKFLQILWKPFTQLWLRATEFGISLYIATDVLFL